MNNNLNNYSGAESQSLSGASPLSSHRNSSRKKILTSQKSALNFNSFNNENRGDSALNIQKNRISKQQSMILVGG